ncbi:RNB domain-containing ribonuclease [Agromyces protaetiae]|uniref:RNB domain-containing ribonuclease n=1 Tax=Agromyces protaetiae TaxID=2509455 RepID=A0A4P6FE66_9MICO|nr:RNB domain-containing ribonuclease [Agromyces protaetiae]QAY74422.1 RNB domain-containing ribonuclease [Agromyces protaetiae]
MPARTPLLARSAAQNELAASLAALREELELPGAFAPEVLAEADASVRAYRLPDHDSRDIPFVTIDPPGTTDLDQALHLEREGRGYRLRYAIADVSGFVLPGGEVDAEARRRGQTLYAIDGRVTMHPPAIGERAASLLPGVDRGAFVWDVSLDADGAVTRVDVSRQAVRSRAQLSYAEVQAAIDAGRLDDDDPLTLLSRVGPLRIEQEAARGGASLNTPQVEVVKGDDGYALVRRMSLPVEDWNAQISLLTGMAAASIMLEAKVGVLRTMPAAADDAIAKFRAQTVALGLPWAEGVQYGEYLRSLDRSDPQAMAVLEAAGGLFRGAGYAAMNGTAPDDPVQAALAAPYAHVTAPLRRLVDRWNLVVCEALAAGDDVPDWARSSLDELPKLMGVSGNLASRLSGSTIARVEAAVLSGRVGERFSAIVTRVRDGKAEVHLDEPAVEANCPAAPDWRAGSRVEVVLTSADVATGAIRLTPVA